MRYIAYAAGAITAWAYGADYVASLAVGAGCYFGWAMAMYLTDVTGL